MCVCACVCVYVCVCVCVCVCTNRKPLAVRMESRKLSEIVARNRQL